MSKAIKYAALAVLAASSAEAFTGSAFTGLTPKLRNSAVATRAAKSHGPDMSLVVVTGARCCADHLRALMPVHSAHIRRIQVVPILIGNMLDAAVASARRSPSSSARGECESCGSLSFSRKGDRRDRWFDDNARTTYQLRGSASWRQCVLTWLPK
jgi:hypothetical protein